MSELRDIKDVTSLDGQMESYAQTCEMMADYLQDLKKHVKTLTNCDYSLQLDNIGKAQYALYEASKHLSENGQKLNVGGCLFISATANHSIKGWVPIEWFIFYVTFCEKVTLLTFDTVTLKSEYHLEAIKGEVEGQERTPHVYILLWQNV